MTTAKPVPVWAVVRYESFPSDPHLSFTVKEVLPSAREADREAERLNELVQHLEGTFYFVAESSFYPSGRGSLDGSQLDGGESG